MLLGVVGGIVRVVDSMLIPITHPVHCMCWIILMCTLAQEVEEIDEGGQKLEVSLHLVIAPHAMPYCLCHLSVALLSWSIHREPYMQDGASNQWQGKKMLL
jgi:hypothetical protein